MVDNIVCSESHPKESAGWVKIGGHPVPRIHILADSLQTRRLVENTRCSIVPAFENIYKEQTDLVEISRTNTFSYYIPVGSNT